MRPEVDVEKDGLGGRICIVARIAVAVAVNKGVQIPSIGQGIAFGVVGIRRIEQGCVPARTVAGMEMFTTGAPLTTMVARASSVPPWSLVTVMRTVYWPKAR